MNVQISVNGLGRVDFITHYGWQRNPSVELCGVDDNDDCTVEITTFLKDLEVVAFENMAIHEQYIAPANEAILKMIQMVEENPGDELLCTEGILIHIRPVPKSSKDYTPTPEELQEM